MGAQALNGSGRQGKHLNREARVTNIFLSRPIYSHYVGLYAHILPAQGTFSYLANGVRELHGRESSNWVPSRMD